MNIAPYVIMVSLNGQPRSARLDAFAAAIRRSHGLDALREHDQLLALGTSAAPRMDLPDSGFIWGRLFAAGASAPVTGETPGHPLTEPAEDFARRYWGGYLVVRRTRDGLEVLRDPSGEIPCYWAEIDGTYVLTSQPHHLFDAGLLPIDIDWEIVAQALAFRDVKPARTALRGMNELLPGVATCFRPTGVETHCFWSPWAFAGADDELLDFDTAATSLREVSQRCISAWARCYRQAVVEISGGLDSAIVAAGLALDGNNPACINFWPAAGDPDERPYARAVARKLNLTLREVPLDVEAVDLTASHARNLPRASARSFAQAMDRTARDLGTSIGADVFFAGNGGDCVFCHFQSALPVVDRYLRRGLSRGLWDTIEDVAHLAPTTIWQVARSAAGKLGGRNARLPLPRRNRFIAEDACQELAWPTGNPWLEAPGGVLPGKRRHIWSMLSIQNHLEGYSRLDQGPILSPLLAQPMLELCIRIPTWLWCNAGRNRAVARAAYSDVLPPAVIARRSKGGFDGFGAEIIDRNRALMRDMLLDGELARQNLVDVAAVRTALGHPLPDGEVIVELLALVDQEAWIGAWRRRALC